MIRRACLLETVDDTLLLVRVRDHELWYLPGGTIEAGESAEQALIREISEELSVTLDPDSLVHDCTIVGPALGREGEVELNCFRARWEGQMKTAAEISDVAFVRYSNTAIMAPAVKILVQKLMF